MAMSDEDRVALAFRNGDEDTLRALLAADGYEWADPARDARMAVEWGEFVYRESVGYWGKDQQAALERLRVLALRSLL